MNQFLTKIRITTVQYQRALTLSVTSWLGGSLLSNPRWQGIFHEWLLVDGSGIERETMNSFQTISMFIFRFIFVHLSFSCSFILCIPTAGYIAHLMGLPINLVGACNQNDAFHQILSKGVFREPKQVLKSTSCSMDIMVSWNRVVYQESQRRVSRLIGRSNN